MIARYTGTLVLMLGTMAGMATGNVALVLMCIGIGLGLWAYGSRHGAR